MAALVEAASDLFAERGPDGVSLRDVASTAGVNYGLIHQYVGSKEDLLRLVFRSLSENTAKSFAAADDVTLALDLLVGTADSRTRYVRMLAWALLQGRDPTELLGRSPALTALIDRLPGVTDGEAMTPADPRVLIAALTTMSLGWRLFGSFVQNGAGLGAVPTDEMTGAMRAVAQRLVDDLPGAGTAGST